MTTYQRLSVADQIFLDMESPEAHMHVAGCFLFDARPLRGEHGGIDFERIERYFASRLYKLPRYRQRIHRIPVEGDPIWVDDPTFNLHYHLRHTQLPPPGDERQLKRLCGRIVSQALDRGKPLWEMWVVDGVEGDRVAVVTKVHHCLTDGVGGVELLATLLTPEPLKTFEPAPPFLPRRAPERSELIRDAVARRMTLPGTLARGLLRAARHPIDTADGIGSTLQALREANELSMSSASETPINGPIGAHRRFDWLALELGAIKAIKNRAGATVNDVCLAIATGAFRHFLERRGLTPRELGELDFRAACPVNVREEKENGGLGNRVANLFVRLPIGEADPVARLAEIHETMETLKSSGQRDAMGVVERAAELTHPSLMTFMARQTLERNSTNFVLTNVPGPRAPWYLLEGQLLETYPVVPLIKGHGVDIALMSYCGGLYWGFCADWELVPDLHDLVLATREAFEELGTVTRPAESSAD